MFGATIRHVGAWLVKQGLRLEGYNCLRCTIEGYSGDTRVAHLTLDGEDITPAERNKTQFVVSLACPSDDVLVGVFDSEAEARKFITANPPRTVQGPGRVESGPLAEAYGVRCMDNGSNGVLGYYVTRVVGGFPTAIVRARWGETTADGVFHEEDPFDPEALLF